MRSRLDAGSIDRDAAQERRCSREPVEETRFLFVDSFQLVRIEKGEKPAERAVFRKQHGVAKGRLTVDSGCPAEWRAGLWTGGPYDLWARWSSDAPPSTPDTHNNTLGFAVKLFDIAGRTLAQDDPTASTADLVFQNHDVFFVDDARGMCAISAGGDAYLAAHLRSAEILAAMAKPEGSLLETLFHSVHPYAAGDAVVKLRLIPDPDGSSTPGTSPNYLADDLRDRLRKNGGAFLLQAQPFIDETVTPLDQATVRWEDRHSPFRTVARLEFPVQDVDAPGQAAYGEGLAFSPWRTLHENRPVGSIADARRVAYPSSAALRRSLNNQAMHEPTEPR